MKLGAHVSSAGGYAKAVKRVSEIGGTCLQIFSTSPRGWKPAEPDEEERKAFLEARNECGVDPVYFHAAYLINLAGSAEIQKRSVEALTAELSTASRFGVRGSIIHLGSFTDKKRADNETALFKEDPGAYDDLIENAREIVKRTPDDVFFIIENMGMRKVGKDLEEIAFIIEKLNSTRVRVCLDTCHLHAAGYDLSNEEALETFLTRFDTLIGLELLDVIHVNDSRDEFGSLRDRHENIGEGFVGMDTFSHMLNHPKLKEVPFIAEVPGFDGNGPDKENLDILKGLLDTA